MKRLFFFSWVILLQGVIFAQGVAVNETGAPASASAILDVSSTTKGILFPRMSGPERSAIINPEQGLVVFDTDSRSFWYYSNGWNEFTNGSGFDLPYNGSETDPDKLFSITNTNGSLTSAAIYGRIMNGSGLILSESNGIWGDNANGNGVAGTSDINTGVAGFSNSGAGVSAISASGPAVDAYSSSGFGISSISQTNFGLASLSNAVDKAGVLGTNTNNNGIGYGVIGSIENPTGGAGVFGKNNAVAGHAGLFEITNNTNSDPSLKVTTSGNGPAGYFRTTGLGPSVHFVHDNVSNVNPAVKISNSSNGSGFFLTQAASNTTHGIHVDHNGSGKAIFSTSETGIAGQFDIVNSTNDNASLYASTIGTGLAAKFFKNNTSGSISDAHDPAVLIENNSKGDALKIQSVHSVSVNSALDILHNGAAYGINLISNKYGMHVTTDHPSGFGILAEDYSGGDPIKGIANSWGGAVTGENNNINGIGVLGTSTGSAGVGIKGVAVCEGYTEGSVTGINNHPLTGIGVYGEGTGIYGMGVYGKNASETHAAVRGENTGGGDGIYGYSTGPTANGVVGIAESVGSYGRGVAGFNFGDGDGVFGSAGNNGNGIRGGDNPNGTGRAAFFRQFYATNTHDAVKIHSSGLGAALNVLSDNNSNNVTMARFTKGGTGDYAVFEEENGTNEIRFDNNGKGFFNGGTQTGGADIAEAFDVEHSIDQYEAGDVLIISTEMDRTVAKSNQPYSSLVAGVFATKPGVLMSEEHIDADLSEQVPMGIVGVIPTKVCNEGGEIRRGDVLVTSSLPGVAMKGDPDKIKPGQVLGKALENYSEENGGKIRVLVSVR